MVAARRVVGKPFEKGDPRINRGGRPAPVLSRALSSKLTPDRANKIADKIVKAAEAGEAWAIQMAWDRLEGKAVARSEDGAPGDFDLDLEPQEVDQLRSALKVVRDRGNG